MSDAAKNVLDDFEKWVLKPLYRNLIERPGTNHFIAFVMGKVCLNSRRLYEDVRSAYDKLRSELTGEHPDEAALRSFRQAGYKEWTHQEI